MNSILSWFKRHLSGVIITTGVLFITLFTYGVIEVIFDVKNLDTELLGDNIWIKSIQRLESLEESFYDLRVKIHEDKLATVKGPVLVEIDDETLQALGTYPIPRDNYIKMIDKLDEYGAKVIAFDVLFAEKSQACEASDAKTVDELLAERFVDFHQNNKSIILAYTVDRYVEKPIDPPLHLINSMLNVQGVEELYSTEKRKLTENKNALFFHYIDRNNFPDELFAEQGLHFGYINNKEDFDGVYRQYTLFTRLLSHELEGSLFVPALGLRAYLSTLDTVESQFKISNNGKSTIELGGRKIKINAKGGLKIKWNGARTFFPSVSLHELLKSEDGTKLKNKHVYAAWEEAKGRLETLNPESENYEEEKRSYQKTIDAFKDHLYVDFKDQVVFVGSSAAGAHDLRNTPIDPILPGVYAHMNMTYMFEEDSFMKPHEKSVDYSQMILIAGILLLMLIMFFNIALLDIVGLIAISTGIFVLDFYYFFPAGYEISLFYIGLALLLSYSWITIINFTQASAEKKQIKGAFSRYVAPAIVNDMLENPDKLKVGGDKMDITCLFSDVRDFTSISEMLTPTELASALNRYMGEMTDIVFETNGTLDKYIGDAIVAFWGAPIEIGDHVNQAMDGAVKMLEALPAINEEFASKKLPEFKIGLGLNSGPCSVGNMGSDAIFAYTALGDNMNLGARLESLCKHYGAQILVSEFTYERMDKERFKSRCIDKVRVKGKNEPVGVYEVLYSYHPLTLNPQAFDAFEKGYELFLAGKFPDAIEHFNKVLDLVETDKASLRLKESCEYWIENPPKEDEDWRITTMTTK